MSEVKIVMVDDSRVELNWARRVLSPHGYQLLPFEASIGIQAFVRRTQPEVVLLDVNMPALTGDRVCKMLKNNPQTRDIPVMLYSSLPPKDLEALVARSGADGFIEKNHDVSLLLRRLRNALRLKQSRSRSCDGA